MFVRPAQLGLRRRFSGLVDNCLGVVTTDELVANHLGYDVNTFRLTWRAWGWTSCWRVLRWLPHGKRDVLLDIGCGAGRITCAAALLGYKRVIGIDIAPDFAALARRNLGRLRFARAHSEIVQADATSYRVPDDITVVFLYNPFGGDVLDAALERVFESFDRAPRDIVVAYANPKEHARISQSPRLHDIGRKHVSWRPDPEWLRTQAVQFYKVVAAGA
jgi:precorrin-6B methylase 2